MYICLQNCFNAFCNKVNQSGAGWKLSKFQPSIQLVLLLSYGRLQVTFIKLGLISPYKKVSLMLKKGLVEL